MQMKTHRLLSRRQDSHSNVMQTKTHRLLSRKQDSHSNVMQMKTHRLLSRKQDSHSNVMQMKTHRLLSRKQDSHSNVMQMKTHRLLSLTDFCHANRTTSAEATAAQHTGRTAVWPETGHHGTDVGRTGRLAQVEAVHTRHHHQNDDGHNDNTANERHEDSAGSEVKNTTKESCV